MTDYTDVISLDRAKEYLKIDAGQDSTDAEITGMINSALSYIEKRTNHIFKTRAKVYYKDCALVQQVKVYDYPIQNIDDLVIEYRTNCAIVPTVDGFVTLTTGYEDVEEIPNELISDALSIINFLFYNSENKNSMNGIPDFIMESIDTNRRFI